MSERQVESEFPKGIIWLASYPKSGNTWTRNFLHNLLWIMEGEDRGAADINAMNEFSAWDIGLGRYSRVLGKPEAEITRDDVAKARLQVQMELAENADGLSFVKTHNALLLNRGEPTINGAATSGAVYIVRNPLDIAISLAAHMGSEIDAAINVMNKRGYETGLSERVAFEVYGSWSENVLSWTRKPQRAIFVMRYEDMHGDPHKTFRSLADHLLIPARDTDLDNAINRSSFDVLRRQEEEHGYREKPKEAERFFRSGRVGEWREVLTNAQIDSITAAHGGQMERFDYLP